MLMQDLRKAEFTARIGTVARLHDAAIGGAAGAGEATREDVVEVRADLLGLRHLYVPISGVQDVTGDGLFLAVPTSELEHGDWQTRPSWLGDLG
jgi:hypothetical protein